MNCRRIFSPFPPRQFIGDLTFGGKIHGHTRTWFGGNRRVSPVFFAVAESQSSGVFATRHAVRLSRYGNSTRSGQALIGECKRKPRLSARNEMIRPVEWPVERLYWGADGTPEPPSTKAAKRILMADCARSAVSTVSCQSKEFSRRQRQLCGAASQRVQSGKETLIAIVFMRRLERLPGSNNGPSW